MSKVGPDSSAVPPPPAYYDAMQGTSMQSQPGGFSGQGYMDPQQQQAMMMMQQQQQQGMMMTQQQQQQQQALQQALMMQQLQTGGTMAQGMALGGAGAPVEPPDNWMPLPSMVSAGTLPGLECLASVDSVVVNKVFAAEHVMTPAVERVEFRVRSKEGLLIYKIVREAKGFDLQGIPMGYAARVFNAEGREVARGEFSRSGPCVGNPCIVFCFCLLCCQSQTLDIQVPPDCQVGSIQPKCRLCSVRFDIEREDSGEKWVAVNENTGCCRMTHTSIDFEVKDCGSGRELGSIMRTSSLASDMLYQVHTYTVNFDREMDSKARAVLLLSAHFVAHSHYEMRPPRRRARRH